MFSVRGSSVGSASRRAALARELLCNEVHPVCKNSALALDNSSSPLHTGTAKGCRPEDGVGSRAWQHLDWAWSVRGSGEG
jgi:hypothetical protein